MRITYFFRKPSPVYHSIENIFASVIENIVDYEPVKYEVPYESKGFLNRLKIGLAAKKNQSDVNHITGDIHFTALFLKKKKTILTIHDIGSAKQSSFFKSLIVRFFWFSCPLKRVKYVTVISEFTKKELLENFKIKPYKVIVINNCISDDYKYFPKKEHSTKPVILHIGTKPNKNLNRVANVIEKIECRLEIIGQLSDNQKLLLNEKNIDYKNYYNLSAQEMLNKYIECDILLFVSTYEGFGMPIIEANAVGRPVITSNLEPMNKVASDAALLVNPFNEEEIEKGIIQLIKDDTFRADLVEKGLENAKKYKADYIASQYKELYDKVISKG